MAVFVTAALGIAGGAVVITSMLMILIWIRRVSFVKAAVKRVLGLDVDLTGLECQIHRNPLRLEAQAESVKLYTPSDGAEEDVVVMLPKVKVSITQVARDKVAKLRYKWNVQTVFENMRVNYVYLTLRETNLDRVVKQITKEQEAEVKAGPAKAEKLKDPHKPKAPAEPELMAVTKLTLVGNSKIHLRAGKVALMPPIIVYPMDVEPAVLQTPIGLFVWLNLLVLRTLHNGGHDLALMVAKAAFHAGLYTGDKSLGAVKAMVMGGRTVLDFTFGEVGKAANGTLGAGKVVIDSTWKGASDVSKAVWHGAGAAGTATADFGGHLFTGVVTGASSSGHFVTDGVAYVGHGAAGAVYGTGKALAGGMMYAGKGTAEGVAYVGNGAAGVVTGTGRAVTQGVSAAGKGTADALGHVGKGAAGAFGSIGKAMHLGGGRSKDAGADAGASQEPEQADEQPEADAAQPTMEDFVTTAQPAAGGSSAPEQDSDIALSPEALSQPAVTSMIAPAPTGASPVAKTPQTRVGTVAHGITGAGQALTKGFADGAGSVGKAVTGVGGAAGKGLVDGANGIGRGVVDGAGNVGKAFGSAGNAVTSMFGLGGQKKHAPSSG